MLLGERLQIDAKKKKKKTKKKNIFLFLRAPPILNQGVYL